MTLQKKEGPKKAYENRGPPHNDESQQNDPVAEKLRQQRCAGSVLQDMQARLAHHLHPLTP